MFQLIPFYALKVHHDVRGSTLRASAQELEVLMRVLLRSGFSHFSVDRLDPVKEQEAQWAEQNRQLADV